MLNTKSGAKRERRNKNPIERPSKRIEWGEQHGIVRDARGQEQPKDKEAAQQ
jgi:hypothetical protein